MATRAWMAAVLLSGSATAQQAPPAPATPSDDATTLPTLKVTAPRPEVLDLNTFDNPIKSDPTRFDRAYDPGMSPEDLANAGGIVPVLVGWAAGKVAAGVSKIPGWKDQHQAAIARPPPLSEAEMARAARLLEQPPSE